MFQVGRQVGISHFEATQTQSYKGPAEAVKQTIKSILKASYGSICLYRVPDGLVTRSKPQILAPLLGCPTPQSGLFQANGKALSNRRLKCRLRT